MTFDLTMSDTFCPLSLEHYCLLYVICRLDEFPTSYLALLPSRLRQKLLLSLPVLDVCRLEEDPGFSESLDFNAVWRELFHSRQGSFMELEDTLSSVSDEVQWKEEYFRLVVGLALHYFGSSDTNSTSQVNMHLFLDLLLTVRSPLGIEQWPWLDCSPFYSSSMVQSGTLITLRNFVSLPTKSSEAVSMIVEKCNFSPTAVLVILDEFVQSDIWSQRQEEANAAILKRLLSRVEVIRFISEHVSRPDAVSDIPHFFLNKILSVEHPVLHSLIVSNCSCSDMDHIISSCAPLFSPTKVPLSDSTRAPYTGLRNLMLSPRVSFGSHSITTTAADLLASVLQHQTSLSSVSMCSLNPYHKRTRPPNGFVRLYAALSDVLRQPQMGVLGLGDFSLPLAAVESILFNFFTAENSETHGVIMGGLYFLCEEDAPHCSPGLVEMPDTSLETKQCSFLEMEIPPSLCSWISACKKLRFRLFEMNAVSMEEGDALSLVAEHQDFQATRLVFSQISISAPTVRAAIEKLLQMPHLRQFTLRSRDLDAWMLSPILPHIASGLMKQRHRGTLEYLNLSDISINLVEDDADLKLLIGTIASLPQVESFELVLSMNSLSVEKCKLIHQAWLEAGSGRKMKVLDLRLNEGIRNQEVVTDLSADVAATLLT